MLGVLADHHDLAFSLDDLALFADLLNGWFYLHCRNQTFLTCILCKLFCSPGNAALGQVVNRNLDGHAVTGQNLDIVHTKLSGNMSGHHMTVGKLHLEAGVGKCLNDRALELNNIVLLCQKNPSLTVL